MMLPKDAPFPIFQIRMKFKEMVTNTFKQSSNFLCLSWKTMESKIPNYNALRFDLAYIAKFSKEQTNEHMKFTFMKSENLSLFLCYYFFSVIKENTASSKWCVLHFKVREQEVTVTKFYISEKKLQNATDSIAVSCNRTSHHKVSEFESTVLKSLLKSQSS